MVAQYIIGPNSTSQDLLSQWANAPISGQGSQARQNYERYAATLGQLDPSTKLSLALGRSTNAGTNFYNTVTAGDIQRQMDEAFGVGGRLFDKYGDVYKPGRLGGDITDPDYQEKARYAEALRNLADVSGLETLSLRVLNPEQMGFDPFAGGERNYIQNFNAAQSGGALRPITGDEQSQLFNTYVREQQQRKAADRSSGLSSMSGAIKAGVLASPLLFGAMAAAPGLFGGLGAAAAPTSEALLAAPVTGMTGVSAGSAAGGGVLSGLGSNLLSSTALKGALTGGLGALATGGDFGDALKGAGLGLAGGAFGSSLGSAMGLGTLGQKTLTGALTGAAGGLGSGDTKAALLGGLLGGGGSYVMGGGNVPGLGRVAGAPLQGGMQGPTRGSGILGSLTRGTATGGGASSIGSLLGGNSMQGNLLGTALKGGLSLYGLGQEEDILEKQRQMLMDAAARQEGYLQQAQGLFDPYQQAGMSANEQLAQALAAGFNPSDLASDPGYQFRLQQGEQALGRQMAGAGMTQSGAALKAAQEYGQGLAAQQYQDAYNNWLAQNSQLAGLAGQGMSAAGQQANALSGLGSVAAQRAGIDANALAQQQLIDQRRRSGLFDLGSTLLRGLGGLF